MNYSHLKHYNNNNNNNFFFYDSIPPMYDKMLNGVGTHKKILDTLNILKNIY